MAGGTFTAYNKVRPGVYIRFATAAANNLTAGDRGVVAICEPLSWGPVGQVNEITPNTDTTLLTGYDINSNIFLREIFKGTNRTSAPQKVLLYRPSATSSAAATVTTGNLTATAKYVGARGNDITIVIVANVDDTFTVSTAVSGVVVDNQTGETVADLVNNAWVNFTGSGALAATTGAALTGGANGTVADAAYTAFLTAIEGYKFDVLVYDGTSSTVIGAMAAFIKRIANENGQYAQLVVANATAPDSRFIINVVGSGVTLDDGTSLTAGQSTWWVAGAEAGAQYNESLTYASYPGAAAVNSALTNSQIVAAIEAGDLVLQSDDGIVRIETDINSLVTYTEEFGSVFRKNRVVRLCSQIANDIYTQFSNNFIGVVNNDSIGRSRFKAVIVAYLTDIQANRGIQNFDSNDVTVLQGTDIDSVIVNLAIQPVDSVEKIYMTVEVA